MIREILSEYVSKTDKVWKHDRSQTIGSSEIGQCERRIWFTKRELAARGTGGPLATDGSTEPESWGARVRGTIMEDNFWAKAMKKKFGRRLLYSGKNQQTFTLGDLSTTPDGLLTNLPRDFLAPLGVKDIISSSILLECKTIDPRVNLTEAKQENVFQVQVQMGLVRELTPWKPHYALISYMDASFWDDVSEYPQQWDPNIYEVAKKRATKMKTARDASEVKPEGWIAGGKECEYCPFTRECGIERTSVPEKERAAEPDFVKEMFGICLNAAKVKKTAEESMEKYKAATLVIRDRLREKQVRKIPKIVTWSPVKGRTNYDIPGIKEAARAAGIDNESFSTAGEPSDMLRILVSPD
jgi:hypothetical protein